MDEKTKTRMQKQFMVEHTLLDIIVEEKFYERIRKCLFYWARTRFSRYEIGTSAFCKQLYLPYFYREPRPTDIVVDVFFGIDGNNDLDPVKRPKKLLIDGMEQLGSTFIKPLSLYESLTASSSIAVALDNQINRAMEALEREHPEYIAELRNHLLMYEI